MKQTTTHKIMRRLAIIAVLAAGLVLTGTSLTNAQACLKINVKTKTAGERETPENLDCWLKKAKSGEIDLANAYLFRADLRFVKLTEVNFWAADLRGAILSGTDLSWTDFSYANLNGADLGGAILTKADFYEAYLRGTILTRANLLNAELTDANLSGADLTGAVLTGAVLTDAIVSSKTKGVDFDDWKNRGGKVLD